MAIQISEDFGYVVLVVVLTFIFNTFMSISVGKARKKYKVFYPTLYAIESENKQAKEFNCVQRGHQNFLEFLPFFLILLVLGGIQHPRLAAGLGMGYLTMRHFYFKGYSTGNPENRLKIGGFHFLFLFALLGCTISTAVNLLLYR